MDDFGIKYFDPNTQKIILRKRYEIFIMVSEKYYSYELEKIRKMDCVKMTIPLTDANLNQLKNYILNKIPFWVSKAENGIVEMGEDL